MAERISSDAGALLLGQLDRGLGVIQRMAATADRRDPTLIEHTVETMIGFGGRPQRSDPVFAMKRDLHAQPTSSTSEPGSVVRRRHLDASGRRSISTPDPIHGEPDGSLYPSLAEILFDPWPLANAARDSLLPREAIGGWLGAPEGFCQTC